MSTRTRSAKIFKATAIQKQLQQTRREYLRALERLLGPILQVGDDADKEIIEFPEPITSVASQYRRDLDSDQLAAELGLDNKEFLLQTINNQPALRALGLGVLPRGSAVKREHWEAKGKDNRESIFQEVSRTFGFSPITTISVDENDET